MVKKEFLTVPVDRLIPYANNQRNNDIAVPDVLESIEQCGDLDPIEVDENFVILSGHTRLKAMIQRGQKTADIMRYTGLTDDQKADLLRDAVQQGVPDHLNKNSDLQAFLYHAGLNDKPEIVSDAQLNQMSGPMIYRTVNAHYNSVTDINYTAPEIADQLMKARVTRVSSGGTSVYGDGLYFANSSSHSALYGSTRGNIQKTCQMHGKLNANAKVVSIGRAQSGVSSEIRSGSKLGKQLSKINYESRVSVWSLCKGYNVIDAGNGYYNVLARNALSMSSNITGT